MVAKGIPVFSRVELISLTRVPVRKQAITLTPYPYVPPGASPSPALPDCYAYIDAVDSFRELVSAVDSAQNHVGCEIGCSVLCDWIL